MPWSILELGQTNSPKVLLKARFDDSGYEIQLTDLSRVWSQSLSKEEIVKLAQDTGSSVDPGEDDDQLRIFLGKIESALNREQNTSLTITSSEKNDGSDLRFELSAPLPKPLAPFKWTLDLKQQPQQRIESELVTPLVLQASKLQDQIRQLVDELHDKDRIISKICDRLETSGNDLTTVFPGVPNIKTSRKKGQREQLARYVKGLEDFDEDAWRRHNITGKSHDVLDAHVLGEVFRDLPSSTRTSRTLAVDDWWKNLGEGSEVKQASFQGSPHSPLRNSGEQHGKANGVSQHSGTAIQDEEFQRQVTPPHLKADHVNQTKQPRERAKSPSTDVETRVDGTSKPMEDDSTTDDEDDLDAPRNSGPTRSSHDQSSGKPNSPAPKRLGMIGGQLSQASPAKPKCTTAEEDGAPKLRPKLGAIGSKTKVPDSTSSSLKPEQPSKEISPAETSQLGMIGSRPASARKSRSPPPTGENHQRLQPLEEPVQRQSRAPTRETTPPPRETSEERANSKRNQLKRELEEKAKAPVKKKRKF